MKYQRNHTQHVTCGSETVHRKEPACHKTGTNCRNPSRADSQAGFTLVEMLVVLGVFTIVILIMGDSFIKILKHSNLLSRRAESNIEGVIGLEMFRHDLNQAGFGLPWGYSGSSNPVYTEAGNAPAKDYNDASSDIPRAFVAGNDLTIGEVKDSDYLVLKGTSLAVNKASQRWTYVNYSTVGSTKPRIWSSGNLEDNDRVIVLRRRFTESGYTNQLIIADKDTFYTTYSKNGFDAVSQKAFLPTVPQETFFLYGVTPDGTSPKRPFNRSDYFVNRPTSIPRYCAPNTGVLYKTTLNHDDKGTLHYLPIMDCVANMQVVFGWDMNEDGATDVLSNADASTVSGSGGSATDVQNTMKDARQIRNRLKLVKVYIMAQDGRKDPTFTNDQTILVGDTSEKSLTREFDVADLKNNDWTNYRWKIYRIVVNPKNLGIK